MNTDNTHVATSTKTANLLVGRKLWKNATRITLLALSLGSALAAQEAKVRPIRTQELAGMLGKETTILTVEYPPGGSSAEHRHNAHVFVYVLEGPVIMRVKGGKEVTLGPGQTFYESPEDVHTVSRNASNTEPAKFVVFFVKERGTPLSIPAK